MITESKSRVKAALAVALALASLLPAPAPQPQGPKDGDVQEGWTYKKDDTHPKGGYWWRVKPNSESRPQSVPGVTATRPFVHTGQASTRPTIALPVVGPSTLYLGQAPSRVLTPTHVLPVGQVGTTNCRT